jgi:hypothetical protein
LTIRIDKGDPKPWVHVEPLPNTQHATGFGIRCDRCEGAEWRFMPGLEADAGWVKAMVEKHNACVPRLGALDPWEPGTP